MCCMIWRGIMLNADPQSTWIQLTSDDLMYLVQYKGLSYFSFICISSEENVMHREVWRPDDSAYRHSPLGWQESGFWKSQNLSMLLLELLSWIWKVWEACIEWSEKGYLRAESKHQSRRELMVSHHLFKGLWYNEAPSICPRTGLWASRLSPSLAGKSLPPIKHIISSTACRIGSLTCKEYLYQQPRQTPLLLN